MKKVILGVVMALTSLTSFGQTKLLAGFNTSMNKVEAINEFKSNKETYTSLKLGNYDYRMYTQNFKFDKDGKLVVIGLIKKGAGLTGVFNTECKDVFRDLIGFLQTNGFKQDGVNVNGSNYFEFSENNSWFLSSNDGEKIVKIVTAPNGRDYTFFSVWFMAKSEDVRTEHSKSNLF